MLHVDMVIYNFNGIPPIGWGPQTMATYIDSVHRQGQEPRPELLLAVPPPAYSDSADILSEPRRRSKPRSGEAAQRKNGELQELKYWGVWPTKMWEIHLSVLSYPLVI
jgi:hypothetical protein